MADPATNGPSAQAPARRPLSTRGRFVRYLLPTAVQATLSFVMVPVISYRLGPPEFGIFALVMATAAFVSTAATVGSGYVLATHFPALDEDGRRELVSSLFFVGMGLAVLTALVVFGFWYLRGAGGGGEFAAIPLRYAVIGLAAALIAAPWLLAVEITVLEGSADIFGRVVAAQSVVSALVTVVSLYVVGLGTGALFAGALAGSLAALLGSVFAIRRLVRPRVTRRWVREILRNGIPATFSTAAENTYSVIERVAVAGAVSLGGVGLLAHSVQYRTVVQVGVKAGARAVWPVSLAEAREQCGFPRTKAAWDYMYVAIILGGIFFANLGAFFIAQITHGKFTAAAPLVPLWMIYILVQNSGKPQTAVMWGSGRGPRYARIVTTMSLLAAALVIPAVGAFGLWGVLYVAILQQALIRIAIRWELRDRSFAFADQWVVGGIMAIGAAMAVAHFIAEDAILRLLVFLVEAAILLVLARANIPQFGSQLTPAAWRRTA